jgi:hypothetical protein
MQAKRVGPQVPGRFKVLHSVWWHGGSFYSAVRPETMGVPSGAGSPPAPDLGLSANYGLTRIPVSHMERYAARTARVRYVAGVTVLIDQPFPGAAVRLTPVGWWWGKRGGAAAAW